MSVAVEALEAPVVVAVVAAAVVVVAVVVAVVVVAVAAVVVGQLAMAPWVEKVLVKKAGSRRYFLRKNGLTFQIQKWRKFFNSKFPVFKKPWLVMFSRLSTFSYSMCLTSV